MVEHLPNLKFNFFFPFATGGNIKNSREVSEPARRETAKSTAQRTWSLVRGSWTVVEELPVVVVGASVTGRMAGKAMGFSRPDEVKSPADGLSSISMEATASTTSDSSAAIANLQVIKNQKSKFKIQKMKWQKSKRFSEYHFEFDGESKNVADLVNREILWPRIYREKENSSVAGPKERESERAAGRVVGCPSKK